MIAGACIDKGILSADTAWHLRMLKRLTVKKTVDADYRASVKIR